MSSHHDLVRGEVFPLEEVRWMSIKYWLKTPTIQGCWKFPGTEWKKFQIYPWAQGHISIVHLCGRKSRLTLMEWLLAEGGGVGAFYLPTPTTVVPQRSDLLDTTNVSLKPWAAQSFSSNGMGVSTVIVCSLCIYQMLLIAESTTRNWTAMFPALVVTIPTVHFRSRWNEGEGKGGPVKRGTDPNISGMKADLTQCAQINKSRLLLFCIKDDCPFG